MEFKSEIQKFIKAFQGQIKELENRLMAEKNDFVRGKEKEGWKKFNFFSYYYGNHEEYGEGDIETTYLFHPSVDIEMWTGANFSHGSFSKNEDSQKWEIWFNELGEDMYIDMGKMD